MTLQRLCSNFTYIPIVSRPEEEEATWAGQTGHIQDLWARMPLEQLWGMLPTVANSHIFLCGNPAMVDEMVDILQAEGFTEHKNSRPGELHVERYW
jgi:ferredoxin--NADP+ reductase